MFRRSFNHIHLLISILVICLLLLFIFDFGPVIEPVLFISSMILALFLYLFSIIRRDRSPVRQTFVRHLTLDEIAVLKEELNQYLFSKFFFLLNLGIAAVFAFIFVYRQYLSIISKVADPSMKTWMGLTSSFFISSALAAIKYQTIMEINRDIKNGIYRVEGTVYKNIYTTRHSITKLLYIGKYEFEIKDPKTEEIYKQLNEGDKAFVQYSYGTKRIQSLGKINSTASNPS